MRHNHGGNGARCRRDIGIEGELCRWTVRNVLLNRTSDRLMRQNLPARQARQPANHFSLVVLLAGPPVFAAVARAVDFEELTPLVRPRNSIAIPSRLLTWSLAVGPTMDHQRRNCRCRGF